VSIADEILDEVRRKPGLTEYEIAVLIFGRRNGYQQRVNADCRKLVKQGWLIRDGKGGPTDPFKYRLRKLL
jgi:hypothetical protein